MWSEDTPSKKKKKKKKSMLHSSQRYLSTSLVMTGSLFAIKIWAINIWWLKEKFDYLQEIFERHTTNDEYENFVTVHKEAKAAEWISTKPNIESNVSC